MTATTLTIKKAQPFVRCGQGKNRCNCKSADECGYAEFGKQISLLLSGEQLRDEGIARAEDNADSKSPAWSERAYAMLLQFIKHGREFRNEEFVEWAEAKGLSKPPTSKAYAAIVLRAKRQGQIVAERIDKATKPTSHSGYCTVWIKYEQHV